MSEQIARNRIKQYMPVSDAVLIDNLKRSVELLYENEYSLIARRVNERAVSPVIAHYLQGLFPEHDVDAEYDRNGADLKRLRYGTGTGLRRIRPDVLVHRRGERFPDDLLAVEIKLEGRGTPEERDLDIKKLTALVRSKQPPEDYRYQVGAFLDLGREEYTLQYIRREFPDDHFE